MISCRSLRVAATLAAAVLVALGVWFRLRHLAAAPFWLDEAYSAYAADHGFAFLWNVVPRYETHPPLYYSLVRLWGLCWGETVASRRALGAVAGIAAIPAAAFAARHLGALAGWGTGRSRRLGWTTAALVALQPLAILMSRQVRPYPVMAAVYAAGIALALMLGRDAAARRPLRLPLLAGFAIVEAAMLWLHTLGPLFGGSLAIALMLLVARRDLSRRDGLLLAASQIAAGLLYLPAFLIMLAQAPTWVRSTWLVFRPERLPAQIGPLYANWGLAPQLVALAAAIAGLVAIGRRAARAAAALGVLALLPVAASIALSATVSPVFIVRTLSPVAIPALVLVAAGLGWAGRWRVAAALPLAFLAWSAAAIDLRVTAAPPAQDWYGALRWLEARIRPGDAVWAYPNEGALPLAYAARDRGAALPVRAIPGPVPAFGLGGHFVTGSQGVVSLDDREIAALVARPDAHAPRTIWVLRLGPWKYDPGDALVRALAADRRIVGHWRKGPIDWTGLRRDDGAPPAATRPGGRAGAAAAR